MLFSIAAGTICGMLLVPAAFQRGGSGVESRIFLLILLICGVTYLKYIHICARMFW